MVAVMEQKNPPMEESSKDGKHNEVDERLSILEFQRQVHQPHRFLPLIDGNIYNWELCGVQIALLQIVSSTANDQEQFKVCGTCLKEYIDQEAAKK